MTPEEERDRILTALGSALDEAQSFGKGEHENFRELVQHCREMHDILLDLIKRHPRLDGGGLDAHVRATRAQIREFELLAGLSTMSRH